MVVQAGSADRATADRAWYARSPEQVAADLAVGPATGLSAARAAELLAANGPNALPEEKPKPGWRRFLEQYRSYMQIILVAAAVVSLVIKEWSTGVLLLLLTVLNAVIGMRQEGKAESAMNALKSMMKATARVRRDGSESQVPAEQVVVGDVVLIAAGDEVPADGRIIASSALQIDESALTGESVPAAKDAETLPGTELGPGDQTNMAFMNTPLGATLFNIASGEPFTPAQVLWIHFIVNAPFGFALGFDKESPGLMARRPRPRGESVLTTPVLVTVGLSGLAITIGLLSMIAVGQHLFGSVAIGQSIAFTSFALCLIVAALECRSETGTVLTTATFDSKQINWTILGEFVLAVLVTQMDVFRRLLGTTELNLRQFAWALIPAVALLALWELGKLIARRSASSSGNDVVLAGPSTTN